MKIKLLTIVAISCFVASLTSQTLNIRINQLGYYRQSSKVALVVWPMGTEFEVLLLPDSTIVYSGKLSAAKYYSDSKDSIALADFSAVNQSGQYCIRVKGMAVSLPFAISDKVFREAAYASLRSFYFQRCSYPLDEKYAGIWKRKAGHADTACVYHASTGRSGKVSSPKGWYDAGDYGKYVVNAGISVGDMLQFYELFNTYFPDSSASIPESGNGVNDLLDEVRFELDWLATMQDADGGVYHKITTAGFPGFVLPENDKDVRYILGKCTSASLDFAAMMGMAGRIYKKADSAFAANCLAQAKKAWDWAVLHPSVSFSNPEGISTGGYGDSNFSDEFLWAAAELLISTNDSVYYKYLVSKKSALVASVSGWGSVGGLAAQSLAVMPSILDTAIVSKIKTSILSLANANKSNIQGSAARVSNTGYYWGCNGAVSQTGILLIYGYLLSGDSSLLNASIELADYQLGKNATGYSFISYYGKKLVMNQHHRPSIADGVVMPEPGFISGGPSAGKEDNKNMYAYTSNAQSFIDNTSSYASNEVAINWNASLTAHLAAIDAILGNKEAFVMPVVSSVVNPAGLALTKPAHNASFYVGDSIEVKVTANADDIQKIEFYLNNKYLKTVYDAVSPFKMVLPVGTYTITACLIDKNGLVTEKAALITVKTKTGVDAAKNESRLKVFPNPTSKNFTIQYNAALTGKVVLQLCDISGKKTVLWTGQMKNEKNTLDITMPAALTAGIYMLEVVEGTKVIESNKLVLQ